jgi:hypothetical protein
VQPNRDARAGEFPVDPAVPVGGVSERHTVECAVPHAQSSKVDRLRVGFCLWHIELDDAFSFGLDK